LLEDRAAVLRRVRERMAQIGVRLAVMSGKGGVGKSAVAVNLACALARRGARTGVLDADLHGPSVAKMLGLRRQPLRAAAGGVLAPAPGPCGLSVQSMDFFLQGAEPLDWGGQEGALTLSSVMEEAALADLLGSTAWGELDFLVVDLPPGADRLPALAALHPELSAALVVSIPSEVSLLAVERSIRRARDAQIPLLGLVENMSGALCERCGEETLLFREGSAARLAAELDVELLARIPFDPELAAAADAGRPFAGAARPAARAFDALAERVQRTSFAALREVGW
jgi:ATP-binding protein involved in chromosome partitioning